MSAFEVFNSHPLSTLRKEVSESNKTLGVIHSYKKGMTKPKLIDLMVVHKKRFKHIKMRVKPPPKPRAKRAAKPKTVAQILGVDKPKRAPTAWNKHVAKFRKENPSIKGAAVMSAAKATYKK
jgi:hypothetical protein